MNDNGKYFSPGAEMAFLALFCIIASAVNYWVVKGLIRLTGILWAAL
jgi:hypothetical protein